MTIDLTPTTTATETALPLFRQEHDELRSAARAFVEREIRPHADEWEAAEDFPRELFAKVGGAGFLGLRFDPRWGGSGPDLLAQAVWVQELAHCGSAGVAADLGATTDLAAVYIDRSGTDEQKQRWLAPLLRGEAIGALAITEPEAGSDVAGIRTRARRDGDGWLLDGSKIFITNGAWCDHAIVAATVSPDDGAPGDDPHQRLTLFVVDGDMPGLTRQRMRMLGWRTSHTGELHLDDIRLDDDRRLGDVGAGFAQIMANFAWERIVMSLAAVEGAQAALDLAIAYARERSAFGRTIASFQVWRHRFAGLATRIALGRRLTEHALRIHVAATDGAQIDQSELVRAVAMAKLFTQRLAFDVADDCMQVHGGAGYLMEVPAQRIWRDARLGPIGGGTDEIMRQIIARTLVQG